MKQEKKKNQALLREQAKQSGGDTEELEDNIYYRKSDLNKAKKLALQLHGASSADMELKISRMQNEIEKLEAKFERATSQAQITKAGYIYVISNIGSFGEGVGLILSNPSHFRGGEAWEDNVAREVTNLVSGVELGGLFGGASVIPHHAGAQWRAVPVQQVGAVHVAGDTDALDGGNFGGVVGL